MHRADGCSDCKSKLLVGMERLEFQLVLLKLHCVPGAWCWGIPGPFPGPTRECMGTEEPSAVEALCLGSVFNSPEVLGNGSQMRNGQSSLGELSCTPPKKQPTGSLHLGMVSSQSRCPDSQPSLSQADF